MSLMRVRAIFGINPLVVAQVTDRAQTMHDRMEADTATYANPTLALPAFQGLITNFGTAHQAVLTRVRGARPKREIERKALLAGMHVEKSFVQALADNDAAHAESIIINAGLLVAKDAARIKALLTLHLGKPSGTITCEANVRALIGAGTPKPKQARFFNWQYTLDGEKTFLNAPSTTHGRTVITGLPLMTLVGVRVSMTNATGPGTWSPVVTILVL